MKPEEITDTPIKRLLCTLEVKQKELIEAYDCDPASEPLNMLTRIIDLIYIIEPHERILLKEAWQAGYNEAVLESVINEFKKKK